MVFFKKNLIIRYKENPTWNQSNLIWWVWMYTGHGIFEIYIEQNLLQIWPNLYWMSQQQISQAYKIIK